MNNQNKNHQLDLAAIRARLQSTRGRTYWRSLEELAETPEFQNILHNEFPKQAAEFTNPVSRRNFLKLMGASLALAGVNACTRQPEEKIFPYVRAPEEIVPGKPLFFATAFLHRGFANGVWVESHDGRPTKVEGNPQHPASLGATDVFAQASVLDLYDPDRSQVVMRAGRISTWEAFLSELAPRLEALRGKQGAGLRFLTETITSPTLAAQIKAMLTAFPQAKWHQYEPTARDNVREGARLAFGADVETQYRFASADVILSLDAEFLVNMPGSLRYAREFADRRRIESGPRKMNRLYAVESSPTLTGGMADHRLAMRASEISDFGYAIAEKLGVSVEAGARSEKRALRSSFFASHEKWIEALVRDLQQHRGTSLVIAGDHQPAEVHALAHAMNHALGNVGATVIYTDPVEAHPVNQIESLRELVNDMQAGVVEMLIILGGNPVFNAPADFNFTESLSKAGFRAHLSMYDDETSEQCHWHIPELHALETWSDARAYDGTVSIIQPLIAPLYGGKSVHELLAVFTGQAGRSSHDIVRDYWKTQRPSVDFEKFWQISLHDGLIAGTALPSKPVSLQFEERRATPPRIESLRKRSGEGEERSTLDASRSSSSQDVEIIFKPDPTIWDGRYASNAWLQELPKTLSRLTWDNAAFISPALAERLSLKNEEVVELKADGRVVQAPVWILPGHADNSITLHFGYGRTRTGRVGSGNGFNAYAVRTSNAMWSAQGVEIRKTGGRYALANTQHHHSMENRNLVRTGTVEEYREHPHFVHEVGHDPKPDITLYPNEHKYEGYSWGMAVDLNSCIGCDACTIACQSENNIPIVGKEQVIVGREMHWIRIDRYYEGDDLDNPDTYHQPVMCMHCDNAPCEVVCPVAATVHGNEGLNEMVYNRCVGTRYCSNNCPYKVRRFNFLQYADKETPSLKLMRNPDVTVRTRGIMEKCTYCVQRINAARIEAKIEDREITDGEVVTACQQVCPTRAIVFGDLNDPNSRVSKLKVSNLNYGLLADLNTKPRTTYLAKLRNPNPEIKEVQNG
jgi:molybdopterin-containing oxidoreductase family iron-sulfur binding subunit